MDTDILPLIGGVVKDGKLYTKVEMREMTGVEEDILADARKAQDGSGDLLKSTSARMTEVMSRCTVRLLDDDGEPALERPEEVGEAPRYFEEMWDNAYVGDRGLATVFLRRLSLGDKYVFGMTCGKCKHHMPRCSVDLSKLETRPFFPNEDKEFDRTTPLINGGGSFDTPKKQRVKYKFLKGKDEEGMQKLAEERKDALVTALIFSQIEAINGEPVKWGDLKKLSSRERAFIRDKMDQITGGLDLTIEVTCDKCGFDSKERMNVGDKSFFFPSET